MAKKGKSGPLRGVRGTTFRRFGTGYNNVQLSQTYPDLVNDGNSSGGINIKGGTDVNNTLTTFKIPEGPSYGGGELDSVDVFLYGKDVVQGKSSKPPQVTAYLLNTDTIVGSTLQTQAGGGDMTPYQVGDVAVLTKNIVIGTSQIQDSFPSITCDYFTGNQEGWGTDEITITNNRQSRQAGVTGGLYISPEDAFNICYTEKTNTGNPYDRRPMHGTRLTTHDWATVSRLRQKHGTGFSPDDNPFTIVDDNGNLVTSTTRMIKLTADVEDGWYKTAINLPGSRNKTKYFRVTDVTPFIKSDEKELLSDTKLYGDEVTTDNSIWNQVRGCGEYFTGSLKEGETTMEHVITKAGTVRFISDNVVTKGKCCQLYTYSDAGDSIYDEHPHALTIADDGDLAATPGGIKAVVDAAVSLGPLPMPTGPIPFPAGAAKNEMGHVSASPYNYNLGGYSTGIIEMTFTIPKMAQAAEYTYDPEIGDAYSVVDIGRRSIVFALSNERPDLSAQRFYDFNDVSGKTDAFGGIILIKDPRMGDGPKYGGGIWAFNMNTMNAGGTLMDLNSNHSLCADIQVPDTSDAIGPLVEGETYRITFNIGVAHYTDTIKCTIHTLPDATHPNGRLMLNDAKDKGYINLTRKDPSATDDDVFAVVDTNDESLAGSNFRLIEWYKYLSIWNQNCQNQNGQTEWNGYGSWTRDTAIDGGLDNTSMDMETQLNIDNIRIGNYVVPMVNNTVISTGEDEGISNNDKSGSAITITGSNTRTVQASTASTWTQNTAGTFEQEGRYARAENKSGVETTFHDYGKGQMPGYTIIHLGSNTVADLFNDDAERYLFLNGFSCANLAANSDALYSHTGYLIGAGFYSGVLSTLDNAEHNVYHQVPLGFQGCANSVVNKELWFGAGEEASNELSGGVNANTHDHHITIATDFGNKTSAADSTCTMWVDGFGSSSDLGDTKGFRQKGLIRLPDDNFDDLTPNVGKRENFYMSAKILAFNPTTGIATVDSSEPFKNGSSVKYIAYIMGGSGTENKMQKVDIPLIQIIDNNHIELQWAGRAADGSLMYTNDKLPALYISPYLYWLSFSVCNWKGFEDAGVFTRTASDYDKTDAQYNIFAVENLPNKTYQSALIVSDKGTLGATFNESIYESEATTTLGAEENSWDLNPSKDSTLLDLQDFGFGPFVETDQDTNQGYSGGYAMQGAPYKNGWWGLYDNGMIEKAKLSPGDKINLLLQPKDLAVDHSISYVGVNNAEDTAGNIAVSRRPRIVANYFDELPQTLKNVKIEPDKDGINPVLKWDPPQESDLWFAQVFLDDEPIKNNKHKAFVYMPLNEESISRGPFSIFSSPGVRGFTSAGDHYNLYYNLQGNDIRAGLIPRESYTSSAGTSHLRNYVDVNSGIIHRPDGLSGMRVADTLTGKLDVVDNSIIEYGINSKTAIQVTPTSGFWLRKDAYSGIAAHDYYKNDINPATSPFKDYSTDSIDAVSGVSTKHWQVEATDRPSSEITISIIAYPMAYPQPSYTLKQASDGTTVVTIDNTGPPVDLDSLPSGRIPLSADVRGDGEGSTAPYSTTANVVNAADTPITKYSAVHDTLAMIPSDSSNGDLTNSEYINLLPRGVDATVSWASFTGQTNGVGNIQGQLGLYGTGSAAAGGGTEGIPTHGGNITIIPRSVLWRLGVANTNHIFANQEKIICYLDSSGLVNVWCKIENQNKWLKIQSISSIPKDGHTPTHIAVTFDKDLPRGNLKLYINGKLESFTGDRTATGTSSQLQNDANGPGGEGLDLGGHNLVVNVMGRITPRHYNTTSGANNSGAFGTGDGMFGRVEEFSILPYTTYFVQPSEGKFEIDKPFADINDTSEATPKAHFAKMFLYDYHNIRGETSDDIQQTNNISWRKSAFALDMS